MSGWWWWLLLLLFLKTNSCACYLAMSYLEHVDEAVLEPTMILLALSAS